MLQDTDPGKLDKALETLATQKNGLAGKIADLMQGRHETINAEEAQEIITAGCPQGFTALPA